MWNLSFQSSKDKFQTLQTFDGRSRRPRPDDANQDAEVVTRYFSIWTNAPPIAHAICVGSSLASLSSPVS